MQSKYMTHQNTQCEDVKGIGKPNVQNKVFLQKPTLLFIQSYCSQMRVNKENLHWDLWQLCGFFNSFSAVGIFVRYTFIIWSHLSAQFHQKLHNKASL